MLKNNMKQIQWFPGHMAKALREMQSTIDSVDIIIELLDARVPFSSQNPEIASLSSKKKVLVIMSKTDLSNDSITRKWVSDFESKGNLCIACEIQKLDYNLLKKKCYEVLKEKIEKDKAKGIKNRPIRAMVVGIPNVGKSTFINKVSKRKATKVANKPGVTKSNQYIKIDNDFVLLDTPGVLWPNFEDKQVGINLALIGSIKQNILPNDQLVYSLLNLLTFKYEGLLQKHYEIEEIKVDSEEKCMEIIERIALKRGFLSVNNSIDLDRTIMHILREFANGKLGKISLEEPANG